MSEIHEIPVPWLHVVVLWRHSHVSSVSQATDDRDHVWLGFHLLFSAVYSMLTGHILSQADYISMARLTGTTVVVFLTLLGTSVYPALCQSKFDLMFNISLL